METMTCRALGGACHLAHHGATAADAFRAKTRTAATRSPLPTPPSRRRPP